MCSSVLDGIEAKVLQAIEAGEMAGCVVLIGRSGKIVFHRAFGDRQVEPERLPMRTDTVFDLASLTKPIATATCVMLLDEQGKLDIDATVGSYIADFACHGKDSITLKHLLTHQSGLTPDNRLADYENGRKSAFQNIYNLDLRYPIAEKFVYSDVGFILLDDLIERRTGLTVAEFSRQHLFEPLGMQETGFRPTEEMRSRSATTEKRDGRWLKGEVHDPRAAYMDGVAGHAGLFSTASDLALYAHMMLNEGSYNGQQVLKAETVAKMTAAYEIREPSRTSVRGLGWDKQSGYSSNRGANMSDKAYGHGGFTGTVLWIDPEQDLFFIFLSNRLHPDGEGTVNRLAGRLATMAVQAIACWENEHRGKTHD